MAVSLSPANPKTPMALIFAELMVAAVVIDKGSKMVADVFNSGTSQGAGNSAGSTTNPVTSGSLAGTGYVNPVPGWNPSRVDQGVDGTITSKGFLAPGDSRILIAQDSNPGWDGGGYIAGQFLDGPLKGFIWYAAEGITPLVHAGQDVTAGSAVGGPRPNPYNGILGNIEAGFASQYNAGQPMAQSLPGYGGDQSVQAITAGSAFNNLLTALGGMAGKIEVAVQPDLSLLPAALQNL